MENLNRPRAEVVETPGSLGEGLSFIPLSVGQVGKIDELDQMDRTQFAILEILSLCGHRKGILDDEVDFLGIHGFQALDERHVYHRLQQWSI
jgi:hypothetical protein